MATKFTFCLVILFAIGLLLYKVDLPLVDLIRSRQVQTADTTRIFYRYGIDFLHPKASYLGPKPVNFIVEFPLYNAAVASLYRLNGGVNESFGRVVSIIAFVFVLAIIFFLILEFTDRFTASLTTIFCAYAPVHMFMGRSFQPDETMLALSLLALLCYVRGLKYSSAWLVTIGSVSLALALLIKPTAYYVLFPFIYLLFRKYGRQFLLRPLTLVSLSMVIFPSILWRIHAASPNNNPILAANASTLSSWISFPLYFNFQYYRMLFNFQYSGILVGVGLLLIPLGISVLRAKTRDPYFFVSWLLGSYSTLLLFQKHSMTHDYYHLITVPIASFLMALGYREVLRLLEKKGTGKKVAACLLIFLIPLYFLPITFSRLYQIPERYRSVVSAAERIRELTPSDAVIIASSGSGPSLLYYADRSGWLFYAQMEKLQQESSFWEEAYKADYDSVKHVENLKQEGAQYFASVDKQFLMSNEKLYAYLQAHYAVILNETDFVLYKL